MKLHKQEINLESETIPSKQSKEEKLNNINEIISQDKISISTLQRLFYISFPKAASIIDNLVENEIIERLEKGYNITSKDKLKESLINTFID